MNDTDEDKMAKAQSVLDMLDKLFTERHDYLLANIHEFDHACTLYAKATIIKARLTSKGETT
jgi:ABC-type phosphate/phosphonate transport system ATPase subunit